MGELPLFSQHIIPWAWLHSALSQRDSWAEDVPLAGYCHMQSTGKCGYPPCCHQSLSGGKLEPDGLMERKLCTDTE